MNKQLVEVELRWYPARNGLFSNWFLKNCLYSYFVAPYTALIPYIGEAVYSTVVDRYNDHEQEGLNRKVRSRYCVQGFDVFIASPTRKDGLPITVQLIHDIESVLIYHLKPEENEKKKKSINVAYPLFIENTGEWPFIYKTVSHDGNVVKDPSEAFQEAMFRARMAGILPGLFSSYPLLPGLNQPTPSTRNESNSLGNILAQARALQEPGVLNLMNMVERAKSRK